MKLHPLLHRWLVEYNPLYLLSATLVLGGLTVISREVARGEVLSGSLGVAAIAELYALALIGSAAFLVRIGHRRPAAMLGLLVVVFQGDVTLHVETCAYLGVAGVVASAVWLGLFVVKLRALAWALELRLSRSALLVPVLGALGLAVLPHALRVVDEAPARTALVTLWLFAVFAAGLFTERRVTSAAEMDVRGARCLRATWWIWGALALGHALYWSSHHQYVVPLIGLALPFLVTRWLERELSVWATIAGSLVVIAGTVPELFWLGAVMGAVTLALTATRPRPFVVPVESMAVGDPPYRAQPFALPPDATMTVLRIDRAAIPRLLVGAASLAWLAAYTAAWRGGPLPDHHLGLDLLLGATCLVAARRWRRHGLALPIAPVALHFLAQLGLVPAPQSTLGWGIISTGVGFAALLTALATTWRLGRPPPPPPLP